MSISVTNSVEPQFAFRYKNYTWHKMESEPAFAEKKEAVERKKWLVEEYGRIGYRIIKHKDKFYIYERK